MAMSSDTVFRMTNPPLSEIVARNLEYIMSLPGCQYPNANALGTAAGISPTTVRNILRPDTRPYKPVGKKKDKGYPTLDNLEVIAEKLGVEVWLLLHPSIRQALNEREMYKTIERTFSRLPQLPEQPIQKKGVKL